MAFLELHFYSHALGMDTSAMVLLPEKRMQPAKDESQKTYPVLYLLHGHSDDESCYIRKSNLELLARDNDLIVVMPNVHRSFYCDYRESFPYYTYVTEELPLKIANFFHASLSPQDTYIAGFSMGGFGAMKIALNHPERYAAAASMSGLLDPYNFHSEPMGNDPFDDRISKLNQRAAFGPREDFPDSINDLFALAEKVSALSSPKVKVFQCCGSEDFLIQQNRAFHEHVIKNAEGLNYQYKETHGIHNWLYWNKALADVFDFMGFVVSDVTRF